MISIIIPTYDRNDQLAECLASIRKNSKFQNEIVILHPDEDKMIAKLCSKYKAISVLDGSRARGKRVISLWAIINRGIELSSRRYVCWLNDDCLVLKNWDEYALKYFKTNNDTGLVVLKSKGIGGNPTFRTIKALYDIDCANYAVLDRTCGVRFDEKYSWFYGDADIAVQTKILFHREVVATVENCIIHNHIEDAHRIQNESDPRALRDERIFVKKWKNHVQIDGKYVSRNLARLLKLRRILLFFLPHKRMA